MPWQETSGISAWVGFLGTDLFCADGDVSEVVIYNRVLTDDEHGQVGFYLQDKYGISGSYTGTPPAQAGMLIQIK